MRSPAAQADGRAIRAILLDVWDPIGIAGIDGMQDEYDACIWSILGLLQSGASTEELTDYLVEITVSRFELGEQRIKPAEAARTLRALPLGRTPPDGQ